MLKVIYILDPLYSTKGYDFSGVLSKLREKYVDLIEFELEKDSQKVSSLGVKKFPVFIVTKEKSYEIIAEGYKTFEEIDAILEVYTGTRNYEYITDPAILDQDTRMC
ncbi:MAG: hypothetical protein H7A23_26595 [Leptospiraceae bacterium]|nr:hypothetical protein [Leptospiraceae bacterium]MCP5498142.1 hypothetical protein [Leptospiraceae bacterium]